MGFLISREKISIGPEAHLYKVNASVKSVQSSKSDLWGKTGVSENRVKTPAILVF